MSTSKEDPKRMEPIKYTPWGNPITTDMAIAALIGEEMGTDVTTDLLAISYGATDELGHYTGVRAMELEDMYIRLDQELERLLIELDQRVGADNYTLFLTADHGAVDVPQYVKDIKGSAGYVDTQSWKPKLDSLYSNELDLFPDRITNRYTVDRIINGHIYLPDSAKSTDYMVRIRNFVKAQPGVADAWLASDLAHGPALGSLGEAVANGYMAGRCGDILYSFLPGHMDTVDEYGGKGSEHFTSWNYDTHVPVIFFGQGIKPGEVVRRTTVSDIAATISMIVGCALPDAAVGDPCPGGAPLTFPRSLLRSHRSDAVRFGHLLRRFRHASVGEAGVRLTRRTGEGRWGVAFGARQRGASAHAGYEGIHPFGGCSGPFRRRTRSDGVSGTGLGGRPCTRIPAPGLRFQRTSCGPLRYGPHGLGASRIVQTCGATSLSISGLHHARGRVPLGPGTANWPMF
ncbi:MAG: alkaline phosphatase family protein [Flavobacteriales bacterium]|nr:alkaline phosphatase family protein [Flavobacteriales bacterium]